MYVCMYEYSVDILYLFCMLKFRVRWCTRTMWTMLLPCGKFIGLFLFCLVFLLSILFFKPNVHKTFSRTELALPVMGTIFLVSHFSCLEQYGPFSQSQSHMQNLK